MTVAVLVGDVAVINDDGTVSRTPRDQDELVALEELVATAAGLEEARGDKLTLKSLSFSQPDTPDLIERPGA